MKVLLSIKPKYAELILEGEKKYEFRRAIFKNPSVKKVIIYASSPISKVIGEFEIEDILSLKLSELWTHTMEHSGIDKEFYDSYFSGKDIGHAIKVKSAKRYKKQKELKEFDINYAPQSFAYI
ncbi:MAG: ASCH domain-containing protein [Deltaproteobacteria bacterium]|nr:ASCH domain-containing protein [Candidatus Desulfobacula maris]